MNAFFGYERDFAMRWCAVIFHDFVPKLKKGHEYRRSHLWPVVAEDCDGRGRPVIARLQAKYPTPVDREAA